VQALGARHVCVGYDFTFGRARSGTIALLEELGRSRDFGVTVVAAQTVDGMVCSSTKVREFVLEGRVEGAAILLGRDPEVEGVVIRGDGRGKSIGVPTANLKPETELLPKNGVYAGWADLDGKKVAAAINIGTNPTFTASHPVTVEAHLLDVSQDLYGGRLRVGFTRRLRAEERFPSAEALVAQIKKDIEETRTIWSQRSS
jgi:riboflavin kinase/FMN adenylyltransferase